MKVNWNNKKSTIDFANLRPGRCFIYGDCLYIKCNFAQQAVRLTDGAVCFKMCGEQVTPVNAEVRIID